MSKKTDKTIYRYYFYEIVDFDVEQIRCPVCKKNMKPLGNLHELDMRRDWIKGKFFGDDEEDYYLLCANMTCRVLLILGA